VTLRPALLLLAIALTLALTAACGGGGDLDPAVRQQVLQSSALTLDDLPSGWSESTSLAPPTFKEGARLFGYCGGQYSVSPTGTVETGFARNPEGPFVRSVVRAFKGNDARRFMDEMRAAAENCRSWTEADTQGVLAQWTLAPLASIEADDDTVGVHVTVTYADGLRQEADVVVSMRGQFVTEVNHGATPGVTFLDPDVTKELTVTARERLNASVAQVEGAGGS
jgi:hypothetical protein